MTKAFSKEEKDRIRELFLKKSIPIFEKYGLKRTRIDDLTNAVGVAKGSFYAFFESKEELYMELLETIENDFKAKVFGETKKGHSQDNKEYLTKILTEAFLTLDSYPLIKSVGIADYDYLLRKLPPERIVQHQKKDQAFMESFIGKLEKDGIKVKTSLNVVSNLLLCLFFVSMHHKDFKEEDYQESMRILIGLVVGHITKGE